MNESQLYELLGRYAADLFNVQKERDLLRQLAEERQDQVNELSERLEQLNKENEFLKVGGAAIP